MGARRDGARAVGRAEPGGPPSRGGRLAFEAERGPCDVRSRASRVSTRARRGGPILVWVAPRCGMLRGSCAGTEVSDARGRSARMNRRPDQALHTLRARAPARTLQHASAVGDAHGAPFCAMKGWHGVQVPLTAAPLHPHPHRHPRPSFTLTPTSASPPPLSSQAHGARGRAAPDPAGCPDPGPRARRAAASRPRAVHTPCAPARRGRAAACGLGSAACDPCYGKAAWATRWH